MKSEHKSAIWLSFIIAMGCVAIAFICADCAKHGFDTGNEFDGRAPGIMGPKDK